MAQKVVMQPVESSNLHKIGYDAANKTLHIIFKSNQKKRYIYSGVPLSTWNGLKAAESHGSFFAARIKDNYTFRTQIDK